jgi:hypothetical protein
MRPRGFAEAADFVRADLVALLRKLIHGSSFSAEVYPARRADAGCGVNTGRSSSCFAPYRHVRSAAWRGSNPFSAVSV